MALSADELLRRLLLHVLPGGFVRIRYFGFLANRDRVAKLAQCRAVLAAVAPAPSVAAEPAASLLLHLTGVDITGCPVCRKGRLRLLATFRPGARPVPTPDTS